MTETPFIVTVDTEGDDIWSRPREITTRNARFLPRFQSLCERYGYRPVYLVNYEMASCAELVEFARDVLERDAGEIGMHLHAWNSPPLIPLTDDDFRHQPYLIEYPDEVMREKIRVMTALLGERFDRPVVSHRAGRLGFDGRYAALLLEQGYRVDCSVTPGVDWSTTLGAPGGRGGPDYRGFPDRPYFLSPADIATPARRGLLEVPVTVETSGLFRTAPWAYRLPLAGPVFNRISPMRSWACPGENGLAGMLRAARRARATGAACVELMVHSSELMPGGSPRFRTAAAIEELYASLEALFENLSAWCTGRTLAEFHSCLAREKAA
ncbi:MAG TPA: hypothetical protein VGR86_03150 [Steroidobacteraceae bacterium]|nr:hypothetical protein [Steroidobacteraceae bacterium]